MNRRAKNRPRYSLLNRLLKVNHCKANTNMEEIVYRLRQLNRLFLAYLAQRRREDIEVMVEHFQTIIEANGHLRAPVNAGAIEWTQMELGQRIRQEIADLVEEALNIHNNPIVEDIVGRLFQFEESHPNLGGSADSSLEGSSPEADKDIVF